MKILLVIPPYVLGEDSRAVLPNKAMLPVGPLMVAGLLCDRGHEVEVLDLVFEEEWWQKLPKDAPDILLLSCHTLRNIPCCVRVLDRLTAKWKKQPHTVLGGNVCLKVGADEFRRFWNLPADAVVRGFDHGSDILDAIEKKRTGDIHPSAEILAAEDMPLPAPDLLPRHVRYHYRMASQETYPIYGFSCGGCHWYRECGETYCEADMDSNWIPRPRVPSAELELAERYGYHKIWCVDNLISVDQKATVQFDRAVAKLGMTWSGMTRVELVCKLPTGFIERLAALIDVAMGVEAVSDDLLQTINRSTTRHKILTAFRRVRETGKSATAFVILDLPGSTDQDFWRLYEFLEDLNAINNDFSRRNFSVSFSFYNPPVAHLFKEGNEKLSQPEDLGFYRWPLGCSEDPLQRVVQQAMILYGRWWEQPGWTPNYRDPFLETGEEFGVNFLEGRIL